MSLFIDGGDHGRPHGRHHAPSGRMGTWTPLLPPAPRQLNHPGHRGRPRRGHHGRGHGRNDGARERPWDERRLPRLGMDHDGWGGTGHRAHENGWAGGVGTARRPGAGEEEGMHQCHGHLGTRILPPVENGVEVGGQDEERNWELEQTLAPPNPPSELPLCRPASGGGTRPP